MMGQMQKLVYDGLQRCPYLDGQIARMPLYRQLRKLTLSETDLRFESAERRVGTCLYRTACPTCSSCQGIRLPVGDFAPTRSQRRVLRRWGDRYRVEVGRATFSTEKLELFNRHKRGRGLVGDDDLPMTPLGYVSWLVQTCFHTIEMRYFYLDKLVGVGVVDLGRVSASSVYFYFDPDDAFARLSPGVFSVLKEVELCRRTGRDYLYLGLYVRDCRHLSYKSDYHPHEMLRDGHWRRPEP
jgi:arginine-tRNA-protein transferase